jgi:hypothetical protein
VTLAQDLATGEIVLEIEPSGYGEPEGLRFDDEGSYVFYHPQTDEVLLTVPWEEIDEILDLSPPYLRRDGDGTLYLDPETGQEIILVPMDEFERVMNEAYSSTEALNPEPQTALLFSPDGATWSLQPTTAAFGEAGWIEAMAVGDDVIVAVFRPHGDGYPQTEAEAELYRPPPAQWWLGELEG